MWLETCDNGYINVNYVVRFNCESQSLTGEKSIDMSAGIVAYLSTGEKIIVLDGYGYEREFDSNFRNRFKNRDVMGLMNNLLGSIASKIVAGKQFICLDDIVFS